MERVTDALELLDEVAREEAKVGGADGEVDPNASVRTVIHIRSVAGGW